MMQLHLLTTAVIRPAHTVPPSLYIEHGIVWSGISFWPVWVTYPGHVPSLLFVHLFTAKVWETEKSLI